MIAREDDTLRLENLALSDDESKVQNAFEKTMKKSERKSQFRDGYLTNVNHNEGGIAAKLDFHIKTLATKCQLKLMSSTPRQSHAMHCS